MDIEEVKAECRLEEERGIDILVAQRVGHRAGELRQAIAHILAVIVGSIIGKDLVAILVVDDPAPLRIYPSILQHVEVPDTLALLDTL